MAKYKQLQNCTCFRGSNISKCWVKAARSKKGFYLAMPITKERLVKFTLRSNDEMLKKECNDWEFSFLLAWNIEDTTKHLNKPDFTNFKGRNLGLTKKELLWATFVRSSFIGLWIKNTSTTTKQTLWETY